MCVREKYGKIAVIDAEGRSNGLPHPWRLAGLSNDSMRAMFETSTGGFPHLVNLLIKGERPSAAAAP
jgi:hypothetical protein